MSATYVYVIRGNDDALYVGHTIDLFRRLRTHALESWADRAVRVQAYAFISGDEARRVERNLIADLEPEFNRQGNPRYWDWDAIYAEWAAPVATLPGKTGAHLFERSDVERAAEPEEASA